MVGRDGGRGKGITGWDTQLGGRLQVPIRQGKEKERAIDESLGKGVNSLRIHLICRGAIQGLWEKRKKGERPRFLFKAARRGKRRS